MGDYPKLRVYSIYLRQSPRHKWLLNSNAPVFGEWTEERAQARAQFLSDMFLGQAIGYGQADAQCGVKFSEVEYMNDIPERLLPSVKMDWIAGGTK